MPGEFQTPQEQRSFSGLVDQVILDTGRPAALLSIVAYAKSTLRECYALGLFYQSMIEETTTITGSPFTWQRPAKFRKMRSAKYLTCDEYPRMKLPGRQLQHERYYYYAADDYFIFAGAYAGETLAMANYYWPRVFSYYPRLEVSNVALFPGSGYKTRPAYYDTEQELWMYLNATSDGYVTTLGDPDQEELRQKLSMEFMLTEWYETILEGTKAKTFTAFTDPRGPTSYSNYKQGQQLMTQSAGFESEDR